MDSLLGSSSVSHLAPFKTQETHSLVLKVWNGSSPSSGLCLDEMREDVIVTTQHLSSVQCS